MGFLTGKTAIITGAGYATLSDGRCGSIGYGIATAYAKEGANLVITERNLSKLEKAYPEAFKANVKMPPAGHFGDPETEIGRVCVQLANPDFKYMNGETVTLEGGMGLRP